MMNCWRAKPLLTAFLDQELSPADSEAVRMHLDACPDCAALCARLADVPPIEAPALDRGLEAQLWDELDRALEAARTAPEATRRRFREPTFWERLLEAMRLRDLTLPMPAVVAYSLALLFLLAWAVFSHQRVQVLTAQVQAKDETIRVLQSTARYEPAATRPDGTAPFVAPESALPGPPGGTDRYQTVSTGGARDPYAPEEPQGYYNLVH